MDGRIKFGKVIRVGNKSILQTTVLQTVDHGSPELGTLIFAYPLLSSTPSGHPDRCSWQYRPLSSRFAPRCRYGSKSRPEIPPHR